MNWFHRLIRAYSDWLYDGGIDASLQELNCLNSCWRLYLIAIYYPLYCPIMFLASLEEKYRTKWCLAKCFRMAENPRTTREDFLNYLGGFYEDESAASLADYFMEKKKP